MEKLVCNACGVEKDIKSYYRCKECRYGVMKVCKLCKNKGAESKKSDDYIHPFNLEFRKSEERHFSLQGCTPEDYAQMYHILSLMGYNVLDGDVHQQFLDRFNPTLKTPMKYKRRKGKQTTFLPDGTKIKKTPTKGKGL